MKNYENKNVEEFKTLLIVSFVAHIWIKNSESAVTVHKHNFKPDFIRNLRQIIFRFPCNDGSNQSYFNRIELYTNSFFIRILFKMQLEARDIC